MKKFLTAKLQPLSRKVRFSSTQLENERVEGVSTLIVFCRSHRDKQERIPVSSLQDPPLRSYKFLKNQFFFKKCVTFSKKWKNIETPEIGQKKNFGQLYLFRGWRWGVGTWGVSTRLVEVYKKGHTHFSPQTHRLGSVLLDENYPFWT